MLLFSVIFLFAVNAVFVSGSNSINDADEYLDEVLSVYVPWAVEKQNLKLYELQDFTHNAQERSSDGSVTNFKILYFYGNLTGLQSIYRKSCERPQWTASNITVACSVTLPLIEAKYEGRQQKVISTYNKARFIQHNFGLTASIADTQATVEITSSPHLNLPSVKRLQIKNVGKPTIKIITDGFTDNLASEMISEHFFRK
ncbi:hypothetical protein X975_20304, partial [Stegodyphus mimosarum]